MNNNNLDQLKRAYIDTPIPAELDFVVKKALKSSGIKTKTKNNKLRWIAAIAASIVLFTAGINSSQTFANTLSDIPIIGKVVEVLTFRQFSINEDKYRADIKVPVISGLENKTLENSLNEKYLEENKKLYEQFKIDMEKIKESGGGNLGIDTGYKIKTDNERILSIGRYVVNTVGSSSTTMKYDTIDKKKEVLITLPSLFNNNQYVDIISENIKTQMRERMKEDASRIYWVIVEGKQKPFTSFDKILNNQNFYINNESKLVITFNKYDVAPGSMGLPEFIIPTEVISDILVGTEYIK